MGNDNIQDIEKIRIEVIEECIKIVKCHRDSWDGIEWAIRDLEEFKDREIVR